MLKVTREPREEGRDAADAASRERRYITGTRDWWRPLPTFGRDTWRDTRNVTARRLPQWRDSLKHVDLRDACRHMLGWVRLQPFSILCDFKQNFRPLHQNVNLFKIFFVC